MLPVKYNSNWSNCSQVHNVILNKLGKRDYPISTKSKTNFVTFVRLKYSPLIHSKSETIPTLQQILDKLSNSEIYALKGRSNDYIITRWNFTEMIIWSWWKTQAGDVNYENKEDCDWIIEATPGRNVHLRSW